MPHRHSFCAVPPAPHVIAQLYADYKRYTEAVDISFHDYLQGIGFVDRQKPLTGRDQGRSLAMDGGAELVSVPKHRIVGELRLIVLLVDFADNVGKRPRHEYEDMLFSHNSFLTGSLRDFYAEVSRGQVEVTGSVHGWLRMPQPYSYYVNNQSGIGSYPQNAQKLAEHALQAALEEQVEFSVALDKLNQGVITGLFIVHAGRGAEVFSSVPLQHQNIWSHKDDLHQAVQVREGLFAANYLLVPEDCRTGVCAHELGHLAFQWDDFYDPNYDKDGSEWDGAGNWDLMAGGSWNDGGNTPAHPAGLHKLQHGWVEVQSIAKSTANIVLPPYNHPHATVLQIRGPAFSKTQSLVLENRVKQGFDTKLPGFGLLVWRVDTSLEEVNPDQPAMILVQADGKHDLERPGDFNEGDTGDPFPGVAKVVSLGDKGNISTSFPGPQRSGISLSNIRIDPVSSEARFDVTIAP